MKSIIYTTLVCLFTWQAYGQNSAGANTLTLEEAIDLALKNNKDILIQSEQVKIAESNVYKGNAGLLPTVSLQGSANYVNNQTDITLRTFQPEQPQVNFNESGVTSTTLSAVAQVDYVIIDGFSGRYRYKLLENERSISQIQQEATIANTVVAVANVYCEIAKLQSREELLGESIAVSEERLQRAKDQVTFGQATGLEVLQAQTDINQDINALDDVLLAISNLIRDLNFLTGLEPGASYRVSAVYQQPLLAGSEDVVADVRSSNPDVQLSKQVILIAGNQASLARADLYPTVSAFANYGYFQQENDLQQLAEIQNVGANVGVSVRYNIFTGNRTRREIANAEINVRTSDIQSQQLEESVITEALKALNTLEILQAQLRRESANLGTFEEAFSRTQERYYAGKASSLDLRDAQIALLNVKIQISEIEINLINTNIRLKALRGKIFEA